jgi:hypothetical protein
MTIETTQFLSEAGHWYHPDGKPAYTVKGKNGKQRKTTLRDGKSMGLLPSITTILGCLDKPGLSRWRERLIVENTDNTERLLGEHTDAYIRRIFEKHQKIGKKAADRGTRVHAMLEQYFLPASERTIIRTADEEKILEKVLEELDQLAPRDAWKAEKSVVNLRTGYAGKMDMIAQEPRVIVDYKTKEFDNPDKVKAYPEHALQLAAGALAEGWLDEFEPFRLVNIFISVTEPGLVKVAEHDTPERWAAAFEHLARYYRLVRGLDDMELPL